MSKRAATYAKAFGVWFVFFAVAFLLGTVRELAIAPLLGPQAAHIIGTLAVVVAFLSIIAVFVRRVRENCSSRDFWLIGLAWMLMTISFEFLFFHFVGGKSWAELLADYNVAQGRVWILVLLTTLFGPPAIDALFRGRKRADK